MAPEDHAASPSATDHYEVETRRAAWRRLPARLFAFLVSADFAFVVVFALAVALKLTHTRVFALVNLDGETNPPSWYSSFQLLAVAIPFLLLSSRLLPPRRRASRVKRLWLVLGIGFTCLSIDEGAAVHERMGRALTRVGFDANFHGGGQWAFFYLLVAAALLIYVRRDLVLAWRDWRPEVLVFVLGFAIMATGEMGLEMWSFAHGLHGTAKWVQIGLEEGLGMLGVSFMALSAYRVLGYVLGSGPDEDAAVGA